MAGRKNHFSNANIFFTFLIIAMTLFLLPKNMTSGISLFFYDTFEPLLRIGRNTQTGTLHPQPKQKEFVAYDEYKQIWKSHKYLEAQLASLQEKYERISKIRTSLPQLDDGLVTAKVTGTVSSYRHEVIIDKGSREHVRPGQYVLSEAKNTLIGIVSDTSETAAKVRLLTDAKQSMEVLIRREGSDMEIGAIMVGNGANDCNISMIDKRRDIREGDAVYAASIPNKLSIPLIVGEVVRVNPDEMQPLLWDITVMPAEDMTRIGNVAVIVGDEKLLEWIE